MPFPPGATSGGRRSRRASRRRAGQMQPRVHESRLPRQPPGSVCVANLERRARDLNPRGDLSPPTRLAGEHLRPLGQPSGIGVYECPGGGPAGTVPGVTPVEALERIAELLMRGRAPSYRQQAFRKAAREVSRVPDEEL